MSTIIESRFNKISENTVAVDNKIRGITISVPEGYEVFTESTNGILRISFKNSDLNVEEPKNTSQSKEVLKKVSLVDMDNMSKTKVFSFNLGGTEVLLEQGTWIELTRELSKVLLNDNNVMFREYIDTKMKGNALIVDSDWYHSCNNSVYYSYLKQGYYLYSHISWEKFKSYMVGVLNYLDIPLDSLILKYQHKKG